MSATPVIKAILVAPSLLTVLNVEALGIDRRQVVTGLGAKSIIGPKSASNGVFSAITHTHLSTIFDRRSV